MNIQNKLIKPFFKYDRCKTYKCTYLKKWINFCLICVLATV